MPRIATTPTNYTTIWYAACSRICCTKTTSTTLRSRGAATPIGRRRCARPATDYLLWALQRLYERREDRYLQYVWPMVRLVHDVDDTHTAQYGVYYTQKKPLTLAALEGLPGDIGFFNRS